ncbi:MAG: hypothetical protein KDA89_01375, partial [Planctomycetaceae bacterium]|nr:hypothetical protein [Planctomycetaceae bacterium]
LPEKAVLPTPFTAIQGSQARSHPQHKNSRQFANPPDELFPILRSLGADANKLRNTLAKPGNQAAGQTGKKAATALKQMAQKAGLTVTSGGKHLRVFDDAGNLVTTVPNSPNASGTIRGIAKAIMRAAGF